MTTTNARTKAAEAMGTTREAIDASPDASLRAELELRARALRERANLAAMLRSLALGLNDTAERIDGGMALYQLDASHFADAVAKTVSIQVIEEAVKELVAARLEGPRG